MIEAVAKSVATREVDLSDWGKVVLEEALFRAASVVSSSGVEGSEVCVSLEIRISANETSGTLEIRLPGSVEGEIVTHLPMRAVV